MWFRGKSKTIWLRETSAWEAKSAFRKFMKPSKKLWVFLTFVTLLLIFIPCALAFAIEFRTPPVTVGCRSITILLYFAFQLILLAFSVRSHCKAFRNSSQDLNSSKTLRQVLGEIVLFWSIGASIFVTFVGTLAQITGIFQNCWCAATPNWKPATVSLATDTQNDRDSSGLRNIIGYLALGVLFTVTFLGWYLQRYIRDKFIQRIKDLLTVPANTQMTVLYTISSPETIFQRES